jgi:hypothetical protein
VLSATSGTTDIFSPKIEVSLAYSPRHRCLGGVGPKDRQLRKGLGHLPLNGLFLGTVATARAMRPFAWRVTERRELERWGAPRSGGGRACGGLPELAQGWMERRPGESLHNARVM